MRRGHHRRRHGAPERPRVAESRHRSPAQPPRRLDHRRIAVGEVASGIGDDHGDRLLDGDPRSREAPDEPRPAGVVGNGQLEQVVEQLPHGRGRSGGDLALGHGVGIGDRRRRRVARPEQRLAQSGQTVRGQDAARARVLPQEPSGRQRAVQDRPERPARARLAARVLAQRLEGGVIRERPGAQRGEKPGEGLPGLGDGRRGRLRVARDIAGNRRREARHGCLVGLERDQRQEVGRRSILHDLGSIGRRMLPIVVIALQRVSHETESHGQPARTPSRVCPEAART